MAELAGFNHASSASNLVVRTSNPGVYTLLPFARVFGVSLDWLVSGDGEAPVEVDVLRAVGVAIAAANERKRAERAVDTMRSVADVFRGLSNDELGELREGARRVVVGGGAAAAVER